MAMLDDFDDAEFAELFGAFDDVVASADLKQRTLAAVRGEQGAVALDATVVSPYVRVPDVDTTAKLAKRGRATRPVRRRMNVGALFAAVFAVLLVFGVASWFLPVSSVRIEQDEFVVDLGVNLYGVTVQATAEGDEGKAVLEAQSVTNLRRDEAERRLRSAFDRMRPESRDQDMGSGSTDSAAGNMSGTGDGDATSGSTGAYTSERPYGTDTTPTQQQQPQQPQQQQPQQQQPQQQQNPNQGGQAPQQQTQPEGPNAQPGAGQPQGGQQPQGQRPSTQDANPGTQEPNQGNGGGQPTQNGQGGEAQPSQNQTPQQQTPNPQPGQDAGASSGGQPAPTINRNTEEQAPQTPQGTGDGGAQPAMPSEGQQGDFGDGGGPQTTTENGAAPGDAGGMPADGGEGMPSGGGDAGGPAGASEGGM